MLQNQLYFGDNLDVLRKHVQRDTIDLIYLDPPFNSKLSYNVLYKEPSGAESAAQLHAFNDAWRWNTETESAYDEILSGKSPAAGIVRAFRSFLGENDMMAYLVMMTIRLIEMHRVWLTHGSDVEYFATGDVVQAIVFRFSLLSTALRTEISPVLDIV